MSPLRCLHIGVGNRGHSLLRMICERPDYQPVALMDTDPAFLEKARGTAHLPESVCFTDLDAALSTPDLNACIITSPARFHAAQIRACLERGLHVFVAKPLTYDLNEAVALVETAEKRGLVLLVDQQQQFLLTERTAAQWVRENKFGANVRADR